MSSQNPINDNGAQNKSLLTADGETDSETRRLHSRTRGSVNATVVEIVDANGAQITNFGGSTGLTDTQLRATPVPVSGTVTVDTSLLATSAKQLADGHNVAVNNLPATYALPAAQVTTLTPPAAITGFATSAKQDTLLTELQLKADLTETQPVSLASVPSHAVTNAGTFAVQAAQATAANLNMTEASASAIKTAVETIDNCISGSEAQVDVITLPATPAGTNAIGKFLPPDIDITTHSNYIRKYYTYAGAVTDGIIWSPAAGKRWHITTLYIQTSAAATITLEDDKAGGDDPVWKGELAANSGVAIPFDPLYPMASGEDAADLLITTSAGNVYCTIVGYEI